MSISLLLAILLLVGLYFWLSRRRSYRRRSQPGRFQSSPRLDGRVAGHTQRELLRLVGGNRAVAERLVEQVQVRYPNHDQQWCWEKAIYDIQRDRRS
jgi:hypothetical protein